MQNKKKISCTFTLITYSSVQYSCSVVSNSATPWTVVPQASLSITNSQSPPKPMSIDAIQPSHPLSPSSPPVLNLSQNQGLSTELALCIRWPKYWSFSFSISPSNSGFVSFRIDWFDLLAVQGTLKSLFQHHGLKASILWYSAFFFSRLFWLFGS